MTRRGPKEKAPEKRRDVVVAVRLTPSEAERLYQLCRRHDRSASTLMRNMFLAAIRHGNQPVQT